MRCTQVRLVPRRLCIRRHTQKKENFLVQTLHRVDMVVVTLKRSHRIGKDGSKQGVKGSQSKENPALY